MPHYKYLIVGGGMTADSAVAGIRQLDTEGLIGVIGAEPHPPYNRPPLTKALWKGKPFESIWRQGPRTGVEFHLGRQVVAVDLDARSVADSTGAGHTFDKLLLATGGTPRRLPFGGDQIIYYRTVDTYQRVRELAGAQAHFAVIGGGFIGSEIAAALAMNGRDVTMIFPDAGIASRVFPADLAAFVNDYYLRKGVRILSGEQVAAVEAKGKRFAVRTQAGHEVVVDAVVAGIGIKPNVELAQAAGLRVDNGIVVDELLRTSSPDVYAAGDVAAFYNPHLGQRIRVEHEDNANTMGRAAGRSMAGDTTPYHHLPFFYSDLFELGYEAVGDLDSRLETFVDWQEPFRKGVIYYLRDARVRGVLLWNVWDQVPEARKLIAEAGPFRPADLKGRLPA